MLSQSRILPLFWGFALLFNKWIQTSDLQSVTLRSDFTHYDIFRLHVKPKQWTLNSQPWSESYLWWGRRQVSAAATCHGGTWTTRCWCWCGIQAHRRNGWSSSEEILDTVTDRSGNLHVLAPEDECSCSVCLQRHSNDSSCLKGEAVCDTWVINLLQQHSCISASTVSLSSSTSCHKLVFLILCCKLVEAAGLLLLWDYLGTGLTQCPSAADAAHSLGIFVKGSETQAGVTFLVSSLWEEQLLQQGDIGVKGSDISFVIYIYTHTHVDFALLLLIQWKASISNNFHCYPLPLFLHLPV